MKYKLINTSTGLTLNQHKNKYPLKYYGVLNKFNEDFDYQHRKIQAIVREDGAIGFYICPPYGYDEADIKWLKREDWNIVETKANI